MSLKRLWTRREALPPPSDAATVRNLEELGNPVTLNMALAGCPARDKSSFVYICLSAMTSGLKFGLKSSVHDK